MSLPKLFVLLLINARHSETALILNAINQFQGYDVVLHYDNASLRDADDVFQLNPKEYFTYLTINYDINDKVLIINGGYGFLHVVLLNDPFSFQKYALIRYKMTVKDRLMIVVKVSLNDTGMLKICGRHGAHGAGGVFIFSVLDDSVSGCCYYCGRKMISLRRIKRATENMPELKQFVNNFTNFRGYLFKIGFAQFQPLFYCKHNKLPQCVIDGSEFTLLKTLSHKMNFRYRLIEYSGYFNSGLWETMLDEVRYQKIDWAVSGISQNLQRSKNLDFTKYISHQGYMAIFGVHDDQWLVMVEFLHAVFISNWMVIITIGLSVGGIAVVTKWSLTLFDDRRKSAMDYAFMPLVYLVEQQSSKLQKWKLWKPCVKVIFFLWWFACCCLTTYYKTQQAYVLMSSSSNPVNIDEMADRGFKFEIYHEDWPYLKFNCEKSSLKVCQDIVKKIDIVSDECDSIMSVLQNKIGLIEEEAPLQFLALTKCNLNVDQKYRLRLVPFYPIPNEWHAWPMQESTPFTNAFSRMFSRLEASGLLRHWYTKQRIFHSLPKSNQAGYWRTETKPLNLYHFLFPFVILGAGYGVSLAAYFLEVYKARCK